jgi:hypothetical protein
VLPLSLSVIYDTYYCHGNLQNTSREQNSPIMESITAMFAVFTIPMIICHLIEVAFYYHDRRIGKWEKVTELRYRLHRYSLIITWIPSLPLFVSYLVFLLMPHPNDSSNKVRSRQNQQLARGGSEPPINADITGGGVRYAFLIQAVVLSVAVLLGFFHRSKTAVRDHAMCIFACKYLFKVFLSTHRIETFPHMVH